jgi:hypothetical protein
MTGEFNSSYGFKMAPATYLKTFLPKVVERLNKMAKTYRFSGIVYNGSN